MALNQNVNKNVNIKDVFPPSWKIYSEGQIQLWRQVHWWDRWRQTRAQSQRQRWLRKWLEPTRSKPGDVLRIYIALHDIITTDATQFQVINLLSFL